MQIELAIRLSDGTVAHAFAFNPATGLSCQFPQPVTDKDLTLYALRILTDTVGIATKEVADVIP